MNMSKEMRECLKKYIERNGVKLNPKEPVQANNERMIRILVEAHINIDISQAEIINVSFGYIWGKTGKEDFAAEEAYNLKEYLIKVKDDVLKVKQK